VYPSKGVLDLQLDLQTISILIAAGSVVIGVFMSLLSLRNFTRSRLASVFLDFHKQANKEFLEDVNEIITVWTWNNYEEFMEKYGPRTNPKAYLKFLHVGSFFDSMGKLLQTNVASAKLIPEALAVFAMAYWEKAGPLEQQMSHSWRDSGVFDSTKFLYETVRNLGYRSPVPPGQDSVSES
jgi:hypothetical protein